MSDLFLDLRDKPAVIDFLVDALEYASSQDREKAEKIVTAYQDGEHLKTDKLASDARSLAIATWPARYAIRRYFAEEGSSDEWRKLLSALRPSTAALLKRFRDANRLGTVDASLAHAESDVALRDEERSEIEHVRIQVRHETWREKQGALATLKSEGERELVQSIGKLRTLRDIAVESEPSIQDEIFSKIARYEDKMYFAGESVPLEILDQEIAYYTDQKEVDPLEKEGRPLRGRKRPPEI
ncbi:MAG: hypothetical protein WA001_03700 [Patescibacteria group bacterium]